MGWVDVIGMEPRSVFDGLLVFGVALAVYLHAYAPGVSTAPFHDLSIAMRNLDIAFYLVVAGTLGIVFIAFITLYMPKRHSNRPPEQS